MATILVIEDDPNSLELIAYLLTSFGHLPLKAVDGEAGLISAYQNIPDLILCDVQIPKLHGFEVVARLKQDPLLAQIPVIAVTAFAMVGDRERVLAAGFDGYIPKPIAPETFIEQLEKYLVSGEATALPRRYDPAPDAVPMAAKHASILVVDNSPTNLEFMLALLQLSGYEVMTATRIDDALALARNYLPDLILSDLHLQGESGLDLILKVRADPSLQGIPFVFLTSTGWQKVDRDRGLAAGALRYVVRPIDPQALLAEIEACLPQDRQRAERWSQKSDS